MMSAMKQLLFGLALVSLIFVVALAIEYTLLRISMWYPAGHPALSLETSENRQTPASQPR